MWLRQALRSPWTWLAWMLLAAIPLEEIGNASVPGRSGLVSLPGAAADWPSLAWIFAATSLLGLPVIFLTYEATARRIKEPGFLQIVMVSAGSEGAFRKAEIRALPPLALLFALPALALAPFAAAGNAPASGAAVYLSAIAALAAFLIPNLHLVLAIGLRCSNQPSRLAPLLGLALYPLAIAAAFRLILAGLGPSDAALALAACEPTGTALFGVLFDRAGSSASPTLTAGAWFLIAANRLLVAAASAALLRGYRNSASFLEVRAGQERLRLPPALRRYGLPVAAGLVAALLAVSNLQSNFGKNLLFYEVDPTMSFLFDRAIGGLETPLLLLLPLIFVHAAWKDQESGFQVFRDMSARGERHRVLGLLVSALACCVVFYAILMAAIAFGFGAHPGNFDVRATLVHFAANSMPTVLLAALGATALSLLAPNRVIGMALAGALAAAWLGATRASPELAAFAAPLLPQPVRYSEALGGLLAWHSLAEHGLVCLAAVAAAAALLIAAWPRPHRWSGFRRLSGDRRAAGTFLALAVVGAAAAAAAPKAAGGHPDAAAEADTRQAYERAASAVRGDGAWRLDRALLRGRWLDAETLLLSGTLHLSGSGALRLTWAAEPGAISELRLDGARAGAVPLGGGLYDLGLPRGRSAALSFAVRLTGPSARLTTLYGDRPTIPLPGILADQFLADDAARHARRMEGLAAAVVPYARGREASRPMAEVELALEYPCALSLTAPFGPAPQRRDAQWCRRSTGPVTTRLELFAAVGPRLRETRVDGALPLTTLAPIRFGDRQRRLDAASADASRDVAALMGPFPVPGITIAGAETGDLASSALSKPGLIRVSDAYLLARRAGRPDPIYGTMAHELMHQWYGHWVRPVASRPGAIFVNEFPAQMARAWAILHRYGHEAYAAELRQAGSRLYYIQHFETVPDEPPVRTVQAEEIYPRSTLIVHFLAAHSGWPAQAAAIRDFARRHGGATATAAELAEAVLGPLAPKAKALGRAMLFDGLLVRAANGGSIALDCGARACASGDIEVPVRLPGGSVRWVRASAYRMTMGPLVGIALQ